jgi:Skp family chaperone for outer membrane proteins
MTKLQPSNFNWDLHSNMRNTFIIVLLIALTGSLVANRNTAEPQDMVRYVDFSRCMAESTAHQSAIANLTTSFAQIRQQLEQQAAVVQKKYSELEIKDPSSESYKTLRSQIKYDEENLKFDGQMAQRRASDQENELFARVLVQINQACAAVGERNGYSALFAKEMGLNAQFPDVATKVDMLSKRTLNWSNPAYDVTDQVIEMLNASAAKPQQIEPPPQQQ